MEGALPVGGGPGLGSAPETGAVGPSVAQAGARTREVSGFAGSSTEAGEGEGLS